MIYKRRIFCNIEYQIFQCISVRGGTLHAVDTSYGVMKKLWKIIIQQNNNSIL